HAAKPFCRDSRQNLLSGDRGVSPLSGAREDRGLTPPARPEPTFWNGLSLGPDGVFTMLTRRGLLQRSALLSLAPAVPGFLARTAMAARPERDGRILVVVQLDGGNDGINTVVPFGDEDYARHRRELRIPTDRVCKLTHPVG